MEVFLVSLLNGLVYGMLLFMLASGLTLILSMMGVLNFAHASAYMLGAYFAYTISQQIGFWPALVLAPLLCGAIGAAIEMYGLRRVHRNGHIAELLFTFGLALIIEKVVQMTWGLIPVPTASPRLDFPLTRSTARTSGLSRLHAADRPSGRSARPHAHLGCHQAALPIEMVARSATTAAGLHHRLRRRHRPGRQPA
jgi:branched-subunit amino acid ABC-type transport system permease component